MNGIDEALNQFLNIFKLKTVPVALFLSLTKGTNSSF